MVTIGLIGGCDAIVAAVNSAATRAGAVVEHFTQLDELGFIGRLRSFALLIVVDERSHNEKSDFQPREIARLVDRLITSLPVVVIHDDRHTSASVAAFPSCVQRVLPSGGGPLAVEQGIGELLGVSP